MDVVAQQAELVQTRHAFRFHGRGSTLFGIQLVNLLFIILTLGIYYFWGKVKVRNYLWSQIEFADDRLAYHGTAREILVGWLKAVLVFGVPFYLLQNIPFLVNAHPAVIVACGFASFVLIYVFIPFAIVGTRRYRLSRTSLRGIRFAYFGRWWDFARFYFRGIILTVASLGFYYPVFLARNYRYLTERSYYGSKKFGFDARETGLVSDFLAALAPVLIIFLVYMFWLTSFILLLLPALFIALAWFNFRKTKFFYNHTTFENARFRSTITFRGFLGLYLANFLILVFTLGFGLPFVKIRTMRYFLDNLTLEGELDFAAITQEAQATSLMGEGFGDMMGIDIDLG